MVCVPVVTSIQDPLYGELEECLYTLDISSEHKKTTELHRAARRGDLDTVRVLKEEKHQNPLQKDGKGDTALHAAAVGGSLEVYLGTNGINNGYNLSASDCLT